jgi:hypothetical protein
MNLLRRLCALFTLAAVLAAPAAALAADKDGVLNKEGFWSIKADEGVCDATMTLQGGMVFMLRADDDGVGFALFGRAPLPRAKVVRLETEAYGSDFAASYLDDDAKLVFFRGPMDPRALASLRLARQVRVLSDGKQIAAMTFEGTGFEGALDGLMACSKGEKGWWGDGAGASSAANDSVRDKAASAVFNEEGIWSLAAGPTPGTCLAEAQVEGPRLFQILAVEGYMFLAVGSGRADLPRGRKGRVETESYAFDFKPDYLDRRRMMAKEPFDSQTLFALARAKNIVVSVDGQVLVDGLLEGSGFPDLLGAVAACSMGEKGWWGDGAPSS